MATFRFRHLLLSVLLITIFFVIFTSSSTSIHQPSNDNTTIVRPSELVSGVCNKTTNYSFCVESLYADPRTPTADNYGLAFVAFGMAYVNATATQDLIANLTDKAKRRRDQPLLLLRLLGSCAEDYQKGASALEMAYNDLNSETFFELADMAGVASGSAMNCQAAFNKAHLSSSSPLTVRNRGLKGLCEICVAVSKLFTGGF